MIYTQHTDMFAFGEKGTRFSVDAMRKDAQRRLERDGWTTTIHMHSHEDPCDDQCEDYYSEEPDETVKPESPCTHAVCAENPMQGCIYENRPDPVPPRIEDHTVASNIRDYTGDIPDYEAIPWGHENE